LSDSFPRTRFIGDTGVLVEFGDRIDDAIHDQVLSLDISLSANPFPGWTTSIPAYASLLVEYDPLIITPQEVAVHLGALLHAPQAGSRSVRTHNVPVCYELGPDLADVAVQTGLEPEKVIEEHLAATYRVYMYGFAPGYAYLGGVPRDIRLPRRSVPVRNIPAGRVMIAGPQCIITTLKMPSGWWVIGHSPLHILRPHDDQPFLFDVGDHVRFTRIARDHPSLREIES
jgi:inhibitor of KinA